MKKLLLKIISFLVLAAVIGPIVFFFMVLKGFFGPLPTEDELQDINHLEASIVLDANGQQVGKFYVQDRSAVGYSEISPKLINGLVATEDQRFFEHQGIDLRSLGRVVIKSILLQKGSGGGSTLTQQLVKNLFPRKNYKAFYYPINKMRELITAYKLEQIYTKEELLELYLNTVSFGEDVYGIESASKRYFNVSSKKLNQQQAAVLVGMLKATTSYNPFRHPDASLKRRNLVLAQMVKQEMLTQTECDSLKKLPLETDYQKPRGMLAPYFLATIRKKTNAFLEGYNSANETELSLTKSGIKIYTTLDAIMQKYAEQAMRAHMEKLQALFDRHWNGTLWTANPKLLQKELNKIANGRSDSELRAASEINVFDWASSATKVMSPLDSLKHHLAQLQAGFLAMQPSNGAIKAWVGGIDYTYFPYDHVAENAKRQVGSTFKPLVYATALENKVSPCTYFKAKQQSFEVKEGEWKTANDHGNYEGKYSMKGALEESVNTVAVNLLNEVGISTTITQARNMGIHSSMPEVPSLALGVASISIQEMVAAYCTFVNGGYKIRPHAILRIEDKNGNILYEYKEASKVRALSAKTAAQMTKLLQGVVDDGTGRSIRTRYKLTNPMGGKTGTTQGNADGWFMAITPHLVSGTWVGGVYPAIRFRDTSLGQGATMALPIWAGFYQQLNADNAFNYYTKPSFKSMPQSWADELDCDPFKEEFILRKWLFPNRKNKDKNAAKEEKSKENKEGVLKKIGKWFKKD
ncbi:MAG: transglycosylase domain-containing protein [Cyclobacteriaceae bacterium]|nr:transglycosylase domain-containing protein [Cyclobacteriaceae bacterium]